MLDKEGVSAVTSKQWKRSQDGSVIYDADFEADATLFVSGDFSSAVARVLYAEKLLALLNDRPKTEEQERAEFEAWTKDTTYGHWDLRRSEHAPFNYLDYRRKVGESGKPLRG
jgi:hypothetical protein